MKFKDIIGNIKGKFGNKDNSKERLNATENESAESVESSIYQKTTSIYYKEDSPVTDFDIHFTEIAKNHIKNINADMYNGDSYFAAIKANATLKKKLLIEAFIHVKHQIECSVVSVMAELNEHKNKLKELVENKIPEVLSKIEAIKSRCEEVGAPFDVNCPTITKMPIQYCAGAILLLTGIFAVTDSLALYNILAIVFEQAAYMSVILCVTLATLLDTLPLPLSDALLDLLVAKDWKRRIEAIVKSSFLVAAFIAILVLVANLRTANIDTYIEQQQHSVEADYSDMAYSEETEEAKELVYTDAEYAKAKAIILMLNLEPILTSIILLIFGFNRARIKFFNELAAELIAAIAEYENRMDDKNVLEGMIIIKEAALDLMPFSEEMHANLLEQIDAEANCQRAEFIDLLKEYCEDSAVTNFLCDQQREVIV